MAPDRLTWQEVERHAAPLPRYTSYPTANHFSAEVGPALYRQWLAALPAAAALSLYLHIPFCQQLCWYCGCSTKAVRRYEPVAAYLPLLEQEMATLAGLVPSDHRVTHVHLGGGSPDILAAADVLRLGARLRQRFRVAADAELAVEIDPRRLSVAQADALARIGVNRVSIGVQDFDPAVQAAIGRRQSFAETARTVELFRRRGIASINIDLVYGLPHQSVASIERTIADVLTLMPDRIAVFGYAHLPARLKHQRLIDAGALPGAAERFAQARRLEEMLAAAGYLQIGLDHFALAHDALAGGRVTRNFQGYTTDQAEALLGLGASAISRLPDGFAQNASAVDDYARRLADDGLATARGKAMTHDDRLRGHVIEQLMCTFAFSGRRLEQAFGAAARPMLQLARRIVADDADGLVEPTADGFRMSARGRSLVRQICARFDGYLAADPSERRHALSV